MCQKHSHHSQHFSRRDFIKLSGAALGAAALACGGAGKVIELTAVPSPSPAKPAVATLAPGEFADTVLVNGNIATMDAKRSIVKAIAVKGGNIVSVGDDEAIRQLAGPNTQVIELGVRAHRHPWPDRRPLPPERRRYARHHLRRCQLAKSQHHRGHAGQSG